MKKLLTVSTAVLILAASSAVLVAEDFPPVKVWTESGPGTTASAYNVYYGGGVFNGLFYTGQLSSGPLAYARTQTGGTALAHSFDIAAIDWTAGETYNGARSTVVIGDYIFFNRTDKVVSDHPRLNRLNSDWTSPVAYDLGNNGGDVAPEGMATDGTSLFTSQHTTKNVIRKYSVSNQATSFSLTKTMDVTVAGASTFRGVSYYNGSIYVADNGTSVGKGIYEINASTGTYTQIGSHAATKAYQAVRYNDKVFVVGQDGKLVVYTMTGGALDAGTIYDLGLTELYGIAVVGNGTRVTGFWVTSPSGLVSFFSFGPPPESVCYNHIDDDQDGLTDCADPDCADSPACACHDPFADIDGDGDVDQVDFGLWQLCYTGGDPAQFNAAMCDCLDRDDANNDGLFSPDIDGNGLINADDFAKFAGCFSGANIPAAKACDD